MIKKINHIGVAVKATEEMLAFWRDGLGLEVTDVETVESQKVKATFVPIGDTNIELLEGTDPESPIAKFVEKRGPGIHHVCLEVEGIEQILEKLKSMGFALINEKPVPGAHGMMVAFIHPKSTGGILVELSESKSG